MRTTLFLCLFSARAAFAVLLAMATFTAMPAHAAARGDFTGQDLLSQCRSTYDVDYGYCAGYVTAVSNTLLSQSIAGHRACNHAPVKSQQLIDIYSSYAEVFPEMMNEDASTAVAAAIERAFPCPK